MKITYNTKTKLPDLPFQEMKDYILGKEYDLTLNIVDAEQIKKLNLIYRNQDKATDILSFPLSDMQGEIYICIEETIKEAKKFDREYENFFAYLFIHGCTHLKGYDHSDTMERLETKARKKFGI